MAYIQRCILEFFVDPTRSTPIYRYICHASPYRVCTCLIRSSRHPRPQNRRKIEYHLPGNLKTSAKVEVECQGKYGDKVCSYKGVTDNSGTYNILVADEHEHEICEVKLVSSPDGNCNSEVPGREKARVFLSHNNGISSDTRYANALGYQKDTPLAFCSELMKMYQEDDV